MNEITVTLPLKEYEDMKKTVEVNHVKNFIHKEYSNFEKNVYTVVVDQDEAEKYFGQKVEGDYKTQQENVRLREVLKEISETPITRGISPVERQLQLVVEKARHSLQY